MALHRDIFWLGRQWAVTALGMQAINQKHDGQFDIPVERLWDDDLPAGLREQKWFNPDDFAKGLAIAQARHPRPPPGPAKAAPPAPPVEKLPEASAAIAPPQPAPVAIPADNAIAIAAAAPKPAPPSNPPPSFSPLRLLGHPARLVRVWRARRRS